MQTGPLEPSRSFPYKFARSEWYGWWAGAAIFFLLAAGGLYQAITGDRPLERWGLIGPPDRPILAPVLAFCALVCAGIGGLCAHRANKSSLQPVLHIVLSPEGIHAPRQIDSRHTEFVAYQAIREVVSLADSSAGFWGLRLDTDHGSFIIARSKLQPEAFEAIHSVLQTKLADRGSVTNVERPAHVPSVPSQVKRLKPISIINWGFWIALGVFPSFWVLFCAVTLTIGWINGRRLQDLDLPLIVGMIGLPCLFVAGCLFLVPTKKWSRLEIHQDGLRLTYLAPRYCVRWVPYNAIRKISIVTHKVQTGESTRQVETLNAYLLGDEVLELAGGRLVHQLVDLLRQTLADRGFEQLLLP